MNTIDAWLERLTAASGEFNRAKVGKLAFIGNVYLNVRPEVARNGQTIRIPFPDTGGWADMAANEWSPTPTTPQYVDVPFGQRPGYAVLFSDFEQMQTATQLVDEFLYPMYLRGQEYANAQIANLITPSLFSTYPALQSTIIAEVDINTAANAWDTLVGNKVPIQDPDQAALIVHNNVHRNMLTDTNWYQENLVGALIAQGTRTRAADNSTGGEERTAFNFKRYWDQQVNTSTTAPAGTIGVPNGSQTVTGSGTTFTTTAPAGSSISFDGGVTYYRVSSVTDDTHLVLGQQFQGVTISSGGAWVRKTYTCVAMHRFAIALAVRPLEIVNDGHVHSRLVMLNGLPFRVVIHWDPRYSGWMLTMDYAMVAKVIRPDFGVVIQC